MFILINCNFDGDSYAIFSNDKKAKDAFRASCESNLYHKVYLLKPESQDQEFGFGSRGGVFGAEVINEWEAGDEADDSYRICGVCGGDASHCDGC